MGAQPAGITTLAARKSKSEPVDAYDDAHDAILESMEVDEENFSQADESSSKESIIESVEPEKSSESVANEIPNDEVPVQEQHVDQVEDEGVTNQSSSRSETLSTVRAQTQSIFM